jgi:mono-ADP-ribosyltransferase sirtuin 6
MELRPTYTHEAIVKLLEMGLFKYVISQNTDGLHRLSGVPPEKISELHGNAFIQKCEKCEKRFDVNRSHRALTMGEVMKVPPKKCERCHISHRTGMICQDKVCTDIIQIF